MKKIKIKKSIIIFMILIMIFLVNGCWDRREPESLAIVVGFGFDYDVETEDYIVIAQIVNPLIRQGGGGGQSGSDKPAFWTVSGEGKSIFLALTDLRGKVSRELYYAHTQIELFSTNILKEKGVIPILDALERTGQTRTIILMAITDDDPKKILTTTIPIEAINVLALTRQIEITYREIAGTTVEKANNFLIDLSTPGIEAAAVMIGLSSNEKEGEESSDSEPAPDTLPPIRIIGKGIFKKDKMIGYLNERETRGCNWIKGEIKTANIDFPYPGDESKYVSILSKIKDSSIEPIMIDGKPQINIKVESKGSLINITGRSSLKRQSEITDLLEEKMAEVIKKDMEMAIAKAKEFKSDVFGFGNAFYRKKYDEWIKMEDDWSGIFADLKINIEVETIIINTGMINEGVKPR